ncbi:MAG TPA: DsbA family protein [Caulobacteraceae bacterium]|jgi:protein-disulfide isomerase|nr:DsbA family protein [Caulobacteraceae bacterium]
MISLGVVALFGLSVPLVLQTLPRRARRIHPDIVRSVLADTASPSVGPARADVTVVVFSDYQCPICRADEPVIERVIRLDPGVRFVFKDWPIFGARSEYAARVALAAARQGRFMPLHDALMRTPDPLTAASVQKLALAAGLDWPEVSRSLDDPRSGLSHQLGRHQFEAWSLGLAGTPAYLVGDDLYEGRLSQAQLDQAIRTARQA